MWKRKVSGKGKYIKKATRVFKSPIWETRKEKMGRWELTPLAIGFDCAREAGVLFHQPPSTRPIPKVVKRASKESVDYNNNSTRQKDRKYRKIKILKYPFYEGGGDFFFIFILCNFDSGPVVKAVFKNNSESPRWNNHPFWRTY